MKKKSPKVKLTSHGDYLIIETVDPGKKHPDFVPAGGGRIGCVIMDTAKNVGASQEAIEWLRRVSRNHDDIGDVDSFKAGEKWVFGWLGGVMNLKNIADGLSGSRTFTADFPHVKIRNDSPKAALEAIAER